MFKCQYSVSLSLFHAFLHLVAVIFVYTQRTSLSLIPSLFGHAHVGYLILLMGQLSCLGFVVPLNNDTGSLYCPWKVGE